MRIRTLCAIALLISAACSASPMPSSQRGARQEMGGPKTTKVLTVGIGTGVQALSIMAARTTIGGWGSMSELHSEGLITSGFNDRRPIGRLAERVPSVEDGSISILSDGRMRVVYHLRQGVTWQDGAPFTAADLVFSYRLMSDPGIPSTMNESINFIESTEAPDSHTFVVYFTGPYFLGASLGVRRFWPQPQHLLGEAYERYLVSKNADDVANLPYWTSQYVHLGPFRLTAFDPGEGSTYEAYDAYFLGRPKVDVVRIRTFADENTLYSNLLAGTVDMVADTALNTDLGYLLQKQWESSGAGVVHVRPTGGTRFLAPQWRSWVQIEPAVLDPKVRTALYVALDREALSEGLPYREEPAWSLLPPGERLYDATKDGFRPYRFDPDRARSMLRDLGWIASPDGLLRHSSDGRHFRTAISITVGSRQWEVPVYADYWRRIGLEVEEVIIPSSQVRSPEIRAYYPGWEASSSGGGDSVLGRLQGPASSAENRWTGERGGYEDPRAQQLLARYYTSISDRDQFDSMKAMSDFIAADLPILITYFNTDHIGARKGVRALEDVLGGAQAGQPYGTYSRNAYLWDIE